MIPEQTDNQVFSFCSKRHIIIRVLYQLYLLTCFLDVNTVFRATGVWTEAHKVYGIDSEHVLIPHDEVGHSAVGSPVLIMDCIPFLRINTNKIKHTNKNPKYSDSVSKV